MEFNLKLKRKERTLIRKIARTQIECLTRLIERKSEHNNIDLHCVINEIDVERMDETLNLELQVFKDIYNNPNSFINLDEVNILMIKHIMETCINKKSLEKYKSSIWRKLNLREKILNYHTN